MSIQQLHHPPFRIKVIGIFVLLVCLPVLALAKSDPDSLSRVWKDGTEPHTVRLEALRVLIWDHHLFVKPDSAFVLAQLLYNEAETYGVDEYRALALNMQAIARYQRGDLIGALELYQRGISVQQARGDSLGVAAFLHNMGMISRDQGNLQQAMELFTREQRIQESLDAHDQAAATLNAIGAVHLSLKDLTQAFEHFTRALDLSRTAGDSTIIAASLVNLGSVELERSDPVGALDYLLAALVLNEAMDARRSLAYNLRSMTRAYMALEQWPEAMRQAERARSIREELGDPRGLSKCYADIAEIQFKQGMLAKAAASAQRALAYAEQAEEVEGMKDAASVLYEVYKTMGRDKEALAMHELFVQMNDSISSVENQRGVTEQRYQYEYEKKEALAKAERDKQDALSAEELQRKELQRNALLGLGAFGIVFALVDMRRRRRIKAEHARSEALLLNILPVEVADELKAKGHADAKHFDNVTILFTDFKGFTQASETMSPQELVAELNSCFKAFDAIITAHGIEKIKTIGDAYMCAGGLPVPASSTPAGVVQAALEMQAFMIARKKERDGQGKPAFEMRVGIHTGPVVAGIVGVKKFAYDIWGDTVNTASRMESSGEVGQVNISEATYEIVKNASTPLSDPVFTFTPRGKVQAKGKGEMEMYFVDRSTTGA